MWLSYPHVDPAILRFFLGPKEGHRSVFGIKLGLLAQAWEQVAIFGVLDGHGGAQVGPSTSQPWSQMSQQNGGLSFHVLGHGISNSQMNERVCIWEFCYVDLGR